MSNNQNMNSMDLGKIEPDAIVVTSSGNFPTEIIANMLLYSIAISCKRMANQLDNISVNTGDIITKMVHGEVL